MLGIDYEFLESAPTELVDLKIYSLYMDFTFLRLKVSMYILSSRLQMIKLLRIFEDSGLMRNFIPIHKGKNVITYVIYSGGIKNVQILSWTVVQVNFIRSFQST